MKDQLKFTAKVLVSLIIINALTDLVPALNSIIYTPINYLKSLFGKTA